MTQIFTHRRINTMCYIVITEFYSRRWLAFSVQDQIINILAFSNLWVLASFLTTELCHGGTKWP